MELNKLTNGELKLLYITSNSKIKKDIRTELKCRGKYKLYITKDEMIDILNIRINKAIEYIDTLDIFEDERSKLYEILKGE